MPSEVQQALARLARAGQQAALIEQATAALANPGLKAAERLALLDHRAEALIALGRFDDAAQDAEAMGALAQASPALQVRALMRQALVQMPRSRNRQALALAAQAMALAEAGRDPALQAQALLCLAEAQLRAAEHDAALASAQRAASMFEARGDRSGTARAQWLVAFACTRLSRNEDSRKAALQAAALAREAGDAYGLANALNVLSFSCTDIAERLQVLRQAEAAFERAGYLFGRMVVLGNLSLTFAELGLWRHACRLGEQCMGWAERSGARLNLALEMGAVMMWQLELGDLAGARARWATYDALVDALDEPVTRADRELWAAELEAAEGKRSAALRRLRAFLRQVRSGNPGFELYVLIPLARLLVQAGDAAAALRATRRGIACLRERGFARTGFGQSHDIWWWHGRALAALGSDDEAWDALREAHRLLLGAVRHVHDEGLRRSHLNKRQIHRELVRLWLAESARRGLPAEQRLEHLRLPSSLADPFKRLVDSGLRLNQLRSEAALHDFLIDEVAELSGAERVLLVLQRTDGQHVVGALLPKGEHAAPLLQAVGPWLDEAAATQEPRLRHGPDGAAEEDQRSCLVAPLVAQGELLGWLYADIEGAFGRFQDADRDLLAMLAGQAAVALANLRFAGGLEAQVAARTAEARSAQAEAEQRAGELALINGIQQGMARSLQFQDIVDQLGDQLRSVFPGMGVQVRLLDEASNLVHVPYLWKDGQRLHTQSLPALTRGFFWELRRSGHTLLVNERWQETAQRLGSGSMHPQTRLPKSELLVPLRSGNKVRGALGLVSVEREHAFDAGDVRLLETLAASLGVALDNARLFKETQEALKQQKASAEVLAVISRSVSDTQPVFDKILDSLKHLFGADELDVLLVDEQGQLQLAAYVGKSRDIVAATFPAPVEITPAGRAIRERRVVHYPDVHQGIDVPNVMRKMGRLIGYQSLAFAPMLWNERGVGAIGLARSKGSFTDKELDTLQGFADQAVIAIQNARLFNETQQALHKVEERTAELVESLDYQTAISDVLRVISESPTDVQPVFRVIMDSAARLFGTTIGAVFRYDGGQVHLMATSGWSAQVQAIAARFYPGPPDPTQISGRVLLSGQVQVIEDTFADAGYDAQISGKGRWRRMLGAPMLKDGQPIGVLVVAWAEPGQIAPRQIDLLKTFADQAVIAIENVRLISETREALAHQTASADILRVISESPTDVQPVFEAIAERAKALCGATVSLVTRFDGEWAHLVAFHGVSPEADEAMRSAFPVRPTGASLSGRAIRDRVPVEIGDVALDPDYELKGPAAQAGYRSNLAVPMLRDGRVIGSIVVGRPQTGRFPERQVKLLQTFADQAVIAIENTRLFNETQEALAHQTASADILRVISSSPTDVQPVFEAIVGTAVKHLGCDLALVQTVSGDTYSPKAMATPAGLAPVPGAQVMPVDPDANFPSRAIRSKAMLHVPDWSAIELPPHELQRHQQLGLNSALYLPLLRGEEPVR